jgi:hypothetical protein
MTTPIVSTSQLIPDGVAGYAKSIAALVAAVLVAVAEFLPDDWQKIVQAVIAVCGVVAVWGVPNAVRPTPPAPVLPADDAL